MSQETLLSTGVAGGAVHRVAVLVGCGLLPDDEHTGRGEHIRQARTEAHAEPANSASTTIVANHQHNTHHNPS